MKARAYLTRILNPVERVGPELIEDFNRQVLRALGPITSGLTLVFAVAVLLNVLGTPQLGVTIPLVVVNTLSVGCLLLLYYALRRQLILASRANLATLGLVVIGQANVLVAFVLTRDAFYLNYLSIVAIICGSVLLSLRWLLASLGVTLMSAGVAWTLQLPEDVLHHASTLTAASALALVILVVRRGDALRIRKALASFRNESVMRRQSESSLVDSEQRLELAIAGSQGGWWDIQMDPDDPHTVPDAISLDPSVKAFIGFEDHEFGNSMQEWRDRILPEDLEAHSNAVADHLAGVTPLYEIEYRMRHRDGGVRWLYSRGRIQRDSNGRPLRWSGIDWDITETKQNQDRLNLLTRAVQQSPSLVVITDTEGTIEYVNPKFTSTTGYSAEEVIGKKPSLLKSEQTSSEVHEDLWRTIKAGREWRGEFQNKKKDGSAYWVIASIAPIKGADGSTGNYLSVQEDITERKKVEAQLARSQNLESVGKLVSGVAHDFNNLLTVVIGFAELGLDEVVEGDPFHREFLEIKKAGESAGDLTQQLLAFSRQQLLEPRVVSVNEVVSNIEELLRRAISENIELRLILDPDLEATRVDPTQLRQILVNLAVNARDAMADGGRLTIETSNVQLDRQHTFGEAIPEAGAYVLLAVTDTGHGMDEATQSRVFEPFFTTKPRGKGSGLGLSTLYGVVKQSGGFVSLYSEVGVGTSFKVYLPRVGEAVEELETSDSVEVVGGTEAILVVEDNLAVRKVTAATLKARGYQVFTCADADQAIRIFSEQDVDLVLTDIVMPGQNGASLAQALRAESPSLKVLLMSGYAEQSVLDAQGLDPGTPFLNKPFRLEDLLTKVRSCLEST